MCGGDRVCVVGTVCGRDRVCGGDRVFVVETGCVWWGLCVVGTG